MNTMTFDTHKAVERLIQKGIDKKHAEEFVSVIQESRAIDFNTFVTKEFLRGEISQLKNELLIWLLGTVITSVAASTATIVGFMIYLK